MSRFVRSVVAAVGVVTSASFLTEATPRTRQAPSQAAKPAASAPSSSVSPVDAAPFPGDWAVMVNMNAFQATFAVSVKANGGRVTGTVRYEGQPTIDVSDISLSGNNLVLKYFGTMGGNPIPTVLTLTPDGAGLRAELVAAEPDVINPTLIEFDGNGRMYVGEMISCMMDAEASREHEPITRISRWESTKGDGRYDKRTVFVDRLVAPRMILPLQDGVILTSETDSDAW